MEVHLFTGLIALFGFFFGFLLTLIGLKYQSSALAAVILTTFNPSYLPFLKSVSLISGAFACDCSYLIVVPPFGWFIFTIWVHVVPRQKISPRFNFVGHSLSHGDRQCEKVRGQNGKRIVGVEVVVGGVGGGWMGIVGGCGGQNGLLEEGEVVVVEVVFVGESGGGG
uniref:Uncharacterized protein n=1 Tax=Fagus sylvatica TaxID=28930 RepID=A0A2N9GJI9_FAGSY